MSNVGGTTNARNILVSIILCTFWIMISACLISFNKYLMNENRFPYSTVLTTIHMTVSWLCGIALFFVWPSLFTTSTVAMNNKLKVLRYFAPIAIFFAIGVVLSNQAYLYCSVAFLQFMKAANVAVIFCFSCAMGSQTFDRLKLAIVCWIITGTAMAVTGEVRFVFIGFLIQAGSQLGECSKNILQEWILSGSDIKLDPLTYNLFMSPVCLFVLFFMNLATWDPIVVSKLRHWWPFLLPNALIAFVLNVTIAAVIKHTSAMGFILSGVAKDFLIVLGSTYITGGQLNMQQIMGFSMATGGIFLWSYLKISPYAPVVRVLKQMMGMPDDIEKGKTCEEGVPILFKDGKQKV